MQKDTNEKNFIFKWFVVATAGYCFGIVISSSNNYALIYAELGRVFNQTKNQAVYAAWIGSMSLGVQYALSIVASALVSMFGPLKIGLIGSVISVLGLLLCIPIWDIRLLFVSYSLVYGLGQSFLLASTIFVLPHYFDSDLALASGTMNLIASIILVLIPIFTSLIIDKYGLKFCFLFLALLNFISCFLVLSFRTKVSKWNEKNFLVIIRNTLDRNVFKNKKLLIWCMATGIGKLGYFIPIINMDHYTQLIYPKLRKVLVNVIFALSAASSGLILGKIDKIRERVHYHTIVYLAYGVVQITIPYAHNCLIFLIQVCLLGLLDGVLLSFIVPISVDMAGQLATRAAAYYYLSMSLTSIIGPAIGGKIYQLYNSYNLAFLLGGSTCVLAGLVLLIGIKSLSYNDLESELNGSETSGKYKSTII